MAIGKCESCQWCCPLNDGDSARLCPKCSGIVVFYKDVQKHPTTKTKVRRSQIYDEPSSETAPEISGIILLILLIFSVALFLSLPKSSPNDSYELNQKHTKAEVMRRAGFEGSDEGLSRQADAIKQFNDLEKQRNEERRKVLGE